MFDLSDIDQVKALQTNLRSSLDSPQGKEVVRFLEQLCGWYDFHEVEPHLLQISHGKRQVLATIKTLLNNTPEHIVAITKEH